MKHARVVVNCLCLSAAEKEPEVPCLNVHDAALLRSLSCAQAYFKDGSAIALQAAASNSFMRAMQNLVISGIWRALSMSSLCTT